jgi:hypothetical protein
VPEKLYHPALPEEIVVAYEPRRIEVSGGDLDVSENITGSMLLKEMAASYLDMPFLDVFAEKYEKPKAFVNGREISVSFSHTRVGLAAGMSSK